MENNAVTVNELEEISRELYRLMNDLNSINNTVKAMKRRLTQDQYDDEQDESQGRCNAMIQYDGKELYTIQECADIIGVTIRSIYKYVKNGALTANRVGRRWYIPKEVLDNYIKGTPYTPAPPAESTEQ